MAQKTVIQGIELNHFISNERNKVLSYLRKKFSISDDDLDDIYQDSSLALYMNIQDGKLTTLTSTLSTYFLRVCINQALKFIEKQNRIVPIIDDNTITNKDSFRADKL